MSSKPIPRQDSGARAPAGCRGRHRCSSGPGTARRPAARAGALAVAPGSGTQHHHRAADVLARLGRRCGPSRGCSPTPAPRAAELGREAVELDHVALGAARRRSPRASRPRRRSAFALDPIALSADARTGGRLSKGTVRGAALGRRPDVAVGAVERLDVGDDRHASRPPGRRWARTRAEKRPPGAPPSSCTVCIGTRQRAKSSRLQLKRARVGADRLDARAPARSRRAASRPGSRSRAVTRWPARARSSAHATGAGADVENRRRPLARAVGQLPPQREIGAVGAALQIVPDDPRGHRRATSPAARLPARDQQLAQREHRGVGRQRVQRRVTSPAVAERPRRARAPGPPRRGSGRGRPRRTSAAPPARPRGCRCR